MRKRHVRDASPPSPRANRFESTYVVNAKLDSAVGLVLAEGDGRPNAMTVSLFSEAAHYPTSLWVSIAQSTYTHELIQRLPRFSLVVLHDGQGKIAERCGVVSGRAVDK